MVHMRARTAVWLCDIPLHCLRCGSNKHRCRGGRGAPRAGLELNYEVDVRIFDILSLPRRRRFALQSRAMAGVGSGDAERRGAESYDDPGAAQESFWTTRPWFSQSQPNTVSDESDCSYLLRLSKELDDERRSRTSAVSARATHATSFRPEPWTTSDACICR